MLTVEKNLVCECGGTPHADWSGDTLHLQCPECSRGVLLIKKRSEDMEDFVDRIAEGPVFQRVPEPERKDVKSTTGMTLP
ncbi:hypothetical protein AKJ61_04805 [candidate division MSBL1 archaeon SCGC-AAA259B11]|uniref:Uncharacterized protein n=1 Tax=candidate division MSBL1 archaeon SCGC-AAA259B11 TaxID=1698260 RepID=A0A133U2S8_9EURY|nr:hypothetical protein AKJ61_04805 [candidate division MSBL1 archaeon SCGC-AAA259B11]